MLEPGFKQLDSREESKTNASDISFFFHFDIALAEPDKQQRPQSAGDKQRVSWWPVILVVGSIIERMLQPSWCTNSSSVLKMGLLRDLPVPRPAGDEEKHGQVQQLMSAQGVQNAIVQRAERLPPSVQQTQDKKESTKAFRK